jgi:hypothetical protein
MRKAGNHHAGKARHLGKLPQRKKRGIGIMSTHLVGEPRLRRGNFNQGVSSVKTK